MAIDIGNWLNIVFVAISIVALAISTIIAIVKGKRSGKSLSLITIFEKIPYYISEAEQLFGSGKGAYKLNYVLMQIKMMAMQNNIVIDEEQIKNDINAIVDATKVVNNDVRKSQVEETTIEQQPSNVDNQINANTTNSVKIFGE